jgi:hypothetical protein
MNSNRYSGPDATRARLRATVSTIDREMSSLRGPAPDHLGSRAVKALSLAWTDLVKQLALGPAPELRGCPACEQLVMRAATLCHFCWRKLTPPPIGAGAAG